MLHIEISGDASRIQLEAAQAALSVLLGTSSLSPVMPELAPKVVQEIEVKLTADTTGVADALKDLPPMPTATPIAGTEGQAAPIAPAIPTPPATPAELAERLMAGETARVAAEELPAIVPPPGVEVDVNGLPHDLRIHAATAGKNKDGSWKAKRAVDPALVAAVTTELKAIMAVRVPEAGGALTDATAAFGSPAVTTVGPATGDVPPPPPVAGTVPLPPVPAAPTPAATPPVATPPAASGMGEFARLMRVVVDKQKAGTLTAAVTTEIAVGLGLGSIRDLAKRPDLIPAFEALLP